MKIAIFATGIPWQDPMGGKEIRIFNIAKKLAKNHEVDFITYGRNQPEKIDQINLIYTPFFKSTFWYLDLFLSKLYFFFFAHLYLKGKYDIWFMSRSPLAVIWTRTKKVLDYGNMINIHWSPITLIDNLSNIIGYIFSDKKINTLRDINPGINRRIFNKQNLEKEFDVLFVGRLEKNKGINEFLDLAKRLPHYKFCIVGAGEIKEKPNNVIHLGKLSQKELARVYNKSKILAITSIKESYGLTILEAKSCGIPTIAYDSVSDLLIGNSGFIIKKNDLTSFSNKIEELLNNQTIYQQLSDNCLEMAKKFDEEEYTKRIVDEITN